MKNPHKTKAEEKACELNTEKKRETHYQIQPQRGKASFKVKYKEGRQNKQGVCSVVES